MGIYRLIKNIIPTFADKQLREMIPWFRQISQGVDELQSGLKAAGQVLGASSIFADDGDSRYGFIATIAHPANGLWNLTLSTPISNDPAVDSVYNYVPMVCLGALGASEAAIMMIGVQMVDPSTIRVRIYKDTGTEIIGVDHDFSITLIKMPGNPATS